MNKTVATVTVAASVAAGSVAGVIHGVPSAAGAAETIGSAGSRLQDALGGLVDDGTLTQQQATAVEEALRHAGPAHRGHAGARRGASWSAAAEAIGISPDELRTALGDGATIAQVAEGRGVDVQTVIDAIVAAEREQLADNIESGRVTQERADELLARVEERAEALVNRELRHGSGRSSRPGRSDGGTWDDA